MPRRGIPESSQPRRVDTRAVAPQRGTRREDIPGSNGLGAVPWEALLLRSIRLAGGHLAVERRTLMAAVLAASGIPGWVAALTERKDAERVLLLAALRRQNRDTRGNPNS